MQVKQIISWLTQTNHWSFNFPSVSVRARTFSPTFAGWEAEWTQEEGKGLQFGKSTIWKCSLCIACCSLAVLRNSDLSQKQKFSWIPKANGEISYERWQAPHARGQEAQENQGKSLLEKCHYVHGLLWKASQGTSSWTLLENVAIKYF